MDIVGINKEYRQNSTRLYIDFGFTMIGRYNISIRGSVIWCQEQMDPEADKSRYTYEV